MTSLSKSIHSYSDRRAIIMLLLGCAAGLPFPLIFSTLSIWLPEAGVERKLVTMFSWAGLGYSFKFLWAPLIDSLQLPLIGKLGKRRSWLLLAQLLIIAAIILMASINPAQQSLLSLMAASSVLLGFSAATQDIVIDAYRIEVAPNNPAMLSVMSSTYTIGYRIGMIVAGAGSLYLADWLGSSREHYVYDAWRSTYYFMAAFMAILLTLTIRCVREPEVNQQRPARFNTQENVRLLLMFVLFIIGFIFAFKQIGTMQPEKPTPIIALGWEIVRLSGSIAAGAVLAGIAIISKITPKHIAYQTCVEPIADFFTRYGKKALLLLALIGLYRISDIVAGVVSNLFYSDLGFSKTEIGNAVKVFGVLMMIMGGILGGVLAQRFNIMKMMMLGAILSAATNLLFVLLAMRGYDIAMLYLVVSIDNLAAGLASTIFVAFLSSLTNIQFSAMQYALFSSLMSLLPKTLGGYSGAIVEHIQYTGFFTFTAALGIPIVLLIVWTNKVLFHEK
ncbi:MFS transporter [Wielerella bovis]|uniref:AmpG family muropeptide MFS transporter n=1 Tax=Wielerella bovis TaxID=2917790 RepID=UPI002018B9C0|nr:MFS transporter [Wielerella bovis]ULJ63423.1 MFS transporter [Wielerella bovis]